MEISHNIYILDHTMFTDNNINFLSYIKKNQSIIRDMGVKISIVSLTPDQLNEPEIENFLKSKQIEIFPVLITDNKIYKGLHDIINIYQTNIGEYHKHAREVEMQRQQHQQQEMIRQQEFIKQQEIIAKQREALKQKEVIRQKEATIDDDEQMHSYISQQLQTKSKMDDDEETPFGDGSNNNMMDMYRHTMTRRGGGDKKNPFGSKMRTLEDNEMKEEETPMPNESMSMQDIIYKQLQNGMNPMTPPKETVRDLQRPLNTLPSNRNQSNDPRRRQMQMLKNNMNDHDDDEEREDNIKGEVEEEIVNIDPSKIEYDADDDPGDDILEKAYWSRNAETK